MASIFSSAMSTDQPANLHLMQSFICQDVMPDGCFLTPVSGLHYVLHLFDQAEVVLLAAFSGHEARLGHVQEVGRQHGDRLTFLECRHVKLNSRFNLKFAADQEFNDWVSNRADEDWINITGLQRLWR